MTNPLSCSILLRAKAMGLTVIALASAATSAGAGTAVLDGPGTGPALYAGPDVHYESLFRGADGSKVETLDKTMAWAFVRLPDGRLGWVESKYLVPVGAYVAAPAVPVTIETSVLPPPRPVSTNGALETASTTQPDPVGPRPVTTAEISSETSGEMTIELVDAYSSVVWPDAGKLNLRAGPGLGFDVLGQMERGDWVSVSAKAGPWLKVEHESGRKGWAYAEFLTQ